MVSLLSRGIGVFVKAVVELKATQTIRCNSLASSISSWQCSTSRWFSNSQKHPDGCPKRPLSAYIRFFVKQMPILHKQHPEIKQVDLTRKIAQEWKELPQYIKEPFVTAASAEQLKYREEYRIYKESLTPSQLGRRREERRQRLAKSKSMKKKRELTVFGRPKRPRNAFNIFMSENFQESTGSTMQSKMKSLQNDWKILPNSQKQTYVQLAEDDKIRYENEMNSWEEQMIDLGREDLIRRKKKRATRKRKVTAKRETVVETLKSDKIMKQQGNMMTKHEE